MKNKLVSEIVFILGMAVVVGSTIAWIVTLLFMTFTNYRLVFYSNVLYEHYIELLVLVIGLCMFLFVFKKRFWR